MEDQVDLPSGGNAEVESCVAYYFFEFEWSGSLHLELLGSSHMGICCLQPNFVSNFPWGELHRDLLLHLLLGHLVGGQSIIASGQIQQLFFQVQEEGLAKGRESVGFIAKCYAVCVIRSLAVHTQVQCKDTQSFGHLVLPPVVTRSRQDLVTLGVPRKRLDYWQVRCRTSQRTGMYKCGVIYQSE